MCGKDDAKNLEVNFSIWQKSGFSHLAVCRLPATSSSPVTLLNRLKGWNAPNNQNTPDIVNPLSMLGGESTK